MFSFFPNPSFLYSNHNSCDCPVVFPPYLEVYVCFPFRPHRQQTRRPLTGMPIYINASNTPIPFHSQAAIWTTVTKTGFCTTLRCSRSSPCFSCASLAAPRSTRYGQQSVTTNVHPTVNLMVSRFLGCTEVDQGCYIIPYIECHRNPCAFLLITLR